MLSLYSNELTGEIPAELGSLANLERLYLSYNQLTGTIPPALGSLTYLEWLRLSRQPVDRYDTARVGQPPQPGMAEPQWKPVDWMHPSGLRRDPDRTIIPSLACRSCDMPGAPTIATLISAGDTSLTVAWTVPINTGTSAITAYDLRYIDKRGPPISPTPTGPCWKTSGRPAPIPWGTP